MDPTDVIMEARQIAEELERQTFPDPSTPAAIARLARCVEELAKRVVVHDGTLYDEFGG
jgi:hypothetical protein